MLSAYGDLGCRVLAAAIGATILARVAMAIVLLIRGGGPSGGGGGGPC